MCVLIRYVHLCGHRTGETKWEPEDATDCPVNRKGARCKYHRVRTCTADSYCNEPSLFKMLSHCRRKAFRTGYRCHCGGINVPGTKASYWFAFSCNHCDAKDCPRSKLPLDLSGHQDESQE